MLQVRISTQTARTMLRSARNATRIPAHHPRTPAESLRCCAHLRERHRNQEPIPAHTTPFPEVTRHDHLFRLARHPRLPGLQRLFRRRHLADRCHR